jgi:hypothetical protein
MRLKGLLILALFVAGVVLLANAARHLFAQQPLLQDTRILFETDYTLSGTLDQDLVLVAEHIQLPQDSRVNGDAALIGDIVTIDGAVAGDLTVLAGRVELGPNARIGGNTALLAETVLIDGQLDGALHMRGSQLVLSATAAVDRSLFACAERLTDARRAAPPARPCAESDLWSFTNTLTALHDPSLVLPLANITVSGAAVLIMLSALASLALSGLSGLAVIVFPRQISYIEEAARSSPRGLAGTGFMLLLLAVGISFALAALLVVVPVLGFVLVPLYLLALLILFGMILAGWVTMTLVAGDLIVRRLSRAPLPPLIIATIGNVALLLAWNLLALHPLSRTLGAIGLLALGLVGLGATFITRLGTRPVHRTYLVQG